MQREVGASSWSILKPHLGWPTGTDVNIWPKMDGPLGCVRIFTIPRSLIAGRIVKDTYKASRVRIYTEEYTPSASPTPRTAGEIIYDRDIHVWMDGSAQDNGLDTCTVGSAWTVDLQISDKISLTGVVLSNNVAEVAAVVLCLLTWRDAHIVVHTDST